MVIPPLLLAGVCVLFGIFYRLPVGALVGASQTLSGLGGLWDSGLATILLLVGIGLGLLLYLVLWMRGKARVADPFVGGESLPPERLRASGVHFYDTVRGLDLLGRIYRIQERGWFDAHVILGKVGGAVTWCLRKLHNGMLSWYLAWSVGGVLLLSALLIWAR
jgi:hypothetical protein